MRNVNSFNQFINESDTHDKRLDKLVNRCIVAKDMFQSSSRGDFSDISPIAVRVAEHDRVDLMQKLIEACDNKEEIKKLYKFVEDGDMGVSSLFDYVQSEEMRDLLLKYL